MTSRKANNAKAKHQTLRGVHEITISCAWDSLLGWSLSGRAAPDLGQVTPGGRLDMFKAALTANRQKVAAETCSLMFRNVRRVQPCPIRHIHFYPFWHFPTSLWNTIVRTIHMQGSCSNSLNSETIHWKATMIAETASLWIVLSGDVLFSHISSRSFRKIYIENWTYISQYHSPISGTGAWVYFRQGYKSSNDKVA